MGRFTLRDEGKTICVGKVIKYKPYKGTVEGSSSAKPTESKSNTMPTTIDSSNAKVTVFDMETGTEKPAAKQLDGIAEGDENEDD